MTTIASVTSTEESGLKGLIKHHPLFSMYMIMFIFAWAVIVPQALYSHGLWAAPIQIWLDLLTGWVPGIAALIVSLVITAGCCRALRNRAGIISPSILLGLPVKPFQAAGADGPLRTTVIVSVVMRGDEWASPVARMKNFHFELSGYLLVLTRRQLSYSKR